MSDKPRKELNLADEIGAKAARKLRAKNADQSPWFGLGMIGLIGWSVALPTLLGAVLGLWMDRHYPIRQSWTLTLLIVGLIMGCLNAWNWIVREEQQMREEDDD